MTLLSTATKEQLAVRNANLVVVTDKGIVVAISVTGGKAQIYGGPPPESTTSEVSAAMGKAVGDLLAPLAQLAQQLDPFSGRTYTGRISRQPGDKK